MQIVNATYFLLLGRLFQLKQSLRHWIHVRKIASYKLLQITRNFVNIEKNCLIAFMTTLSSQYMYLQLRIYIKIIYLRQLLK